MLVGVAVATAVGGGSWLSPSPLSVSSTRVISDLMLMTDLSPSPPDLSPGGQKGSCEVLLVHAVKQDMGTSIIRAPLLSGQLIAERTNCGRVSDVSSIIT